MNSDRSALLEQLSVVATLAEFEALDLDFPHVVRTMLDVEGQPRKASKNVVKAFAQVFQTHSDTNGKSIDGYPRGVEMLAFAAACAPLLEADRLARLVRTAPRALVAYHPGEVLTLGDSLKELLEPYSQQKREEFLKDLWFSAHHLSWRDDAESSTLPEIVATLESFDAVARVLSNPVRYGFNPIEAEEWGREATERIFSWAISSTDPSGESVALREVASLETGLAESISAESIAIIEGAWTPRTLRRMLKPSTLRQILGRCETLRVGVVEAGGPSQEDVEFLEGLRGTNPMYGFLDDVTYLASALTSQSAFQEAYAVASLVDRLVLSTSIHFTPEQATALARDTREATSRLASSFNVEFELELEAWLDVSSSGWETRPEVAEAVMQLRDLAGSVPPGEFILAAQLFTRGMASEFAGEEVTTRIVDRILGDGSSIKGLRSLGAASSENGGPLDEDVFAALVDLGLLFSGQPFQGCFMFSSLLPTLGYMLRFTVLRMMEVLPFDDPVFVRVLDRDHYLHRFGLAWAATSLPLSERPVAPLVSLVQSAAERSKWVDPEGGFTPRRWAHLAFRPDPTPYEYDEKLLAVDGRTLIDGSGVKVRLLKSEAAVSRNAEHMGNCTRSYHRKAKAGECALLYFVVDGVEYNADVDVRSERFSVTQVNTRFNQGNVDPKVEEALRELVADLNA